MGKTWAVGEMKNYGKEQYCGNGGCGKKNKLEETQSFMGKIRIIETTKDARGIG
jgi:hypothetical protein